MFLTSPRSYYPLVMILTSPHQYSHPFLCGAKSGKYSIYEKQKMPQNNNLSTHSSVGQKLTKYSIYEKQKMPQDNNLSTHSLTHSL